MEHLIIQTFSISQIFSRNENLLKYFVMLMDRNLKMFLVVYGESFISFLDLSG